MTDIKVHDGKPMGFGAVLTGRGVNFSIYSHDATKVSLVLFDNEYDQKPARVVDFDPHANRTGDIWHIYIEGLGAGALYLYKAKPVSVPVKVETKEVVRDSIVFRDRVQIQTVEVEKKLNWWQQLKLKAGGLFIIIALIGIVYIIVNLFVKPKLFSL